MAVAVKVDEDLPTEIASLVEASGYSAKTVYVHGHSGMSDDRLWPIIQQEGRMLFTADKGFGNARSYPPSSHAGVVLFRLPHESRAGYLRLAEFLLAQLKLEDAEGAIVVVSPDAIRVRRA